MTMLRSLVFAVAMATCGPAAAQDGRTEILGYYPCASALGDDALSYLRDWANATKNDPCLLGPDAFAETFGFPMASGAEPEAEALGYVEAYFQAQGPSRLFLYQTLIQGADSADGRWGPMTEAAFAGLLGTYLAVGGTGDGWGLRGPQDVPNLLRWIEDAVYASQTGAEFPD